MKLLLILAALAALIRSSVSQCIPGLTVRNATSTVLSGCNEVIDSRALLEAPSISYFKSNINETYLIMLLEATSLSQDWFRLHWLVGDVKLNLRDGLLQTKIGVQDLAQGYVPPMNSTRYEFRLYNMTGRVIWGPVGPDEKNLFLLPQWLNKNSLPSMPLAKTVFEVKAFAQGPSGPGGFIPMDGAHHVLPSNAVLLPVYPTVPQQQPGQTYPSNQQQPSVYPSQQMPYPNQGIPQPQPSPNAPSYVSNYNHQLIPNQYIINGTTFRRITPEMKSYNILDINSTRYSSDFYNKRYKLSSYLIVDNKSYIWRNQTHFPGEGKSLYINGTQYVPYKTPSNEVHHHHYHKNSASTTTTNVVFFTILTPFIFLFSSQQ